MKSSIGTPFGVPIKLGTTIAPNLRTGLSGAPDTPSGIAMMLAAGDVATPAPGYLYLKQVRSGHAAQVPQDRESVLLAEPMAQPHKGTRIAVLARIAPELSDAVRLGAREQGVSVSDFVATLLADALSLPELAPPVHARTEHGQLHVTPPEEAQPPMRPV